jgi:carboxypeptidase C (cathepsin A)
MSNTATKPDAPTPAAYQPPKGVEHSIPWGTGKARVKVHADWLLVREHGVPVAEVFYTSYQAPGRGRPVTFCFNGGPGAASAFLHVGAVGPQRLTFSPTGQILPPPARLVDNAETWLKFTDLVFVDPVGTGLSRTVAESKLEQQGVDADTEKTAKHAKDLPDAKKPFYKLNRDIEVLAEFVAQWLNRFGRWDCAVSIAGESYGGFRVGKLLRALPERGVAIHGAIMISPAIDFLAIGGSDYDLWPWVNTLPTMALAAAYHGRSRGRFAGLKPDAVREQAEAFAEGPFASMLIRGDRTPAKERDAVLRDFADATGLPPELAERHGGRVGFEAFVRELLRDRGLVCGLYDATVTGPNVFPDREGSPSPDPTLAGIMGAYTAGINALLRGRYGLAAEREYLLLGMEVNEWWQDDSGAGYYERHLDCADDMRYGMAVNPAVRLMICHGWYDLITTYFASKRSVSLLRLPDGLRSRVSFKNYDGGHMFYAWDKSRKALTKDAAQVVGG